MEKTEIREKQSYKVVKANEMIQRAKYSLTMTEIKVMSFLFSKVRPTDREGQEYVFTLKEFCEVCGISNNFRENHRHVRKTIDGLKGKHFWIVNERGNEETVDWIRKAEIDKRSGRVTVKLDEALMKYVTGLYERYTQYQLFFVLPMKSAYSFRLYEILKSYEDLKWCVLDVEQLKAQIMAEHYTAFKRFRTRVLDVAVKEINQYTDIRVTWEPIKSGQRVVKIRFQIRGVTAKELIKTYCQDFRLLDGQMDIGDFIQEDQAGEGAAGTAAGTEKPEKEKER